MKVHVCVAQIGYRSGKGHIERLKDIIGANRAADLIVFPELILHGHPSGEKPEGLLYRRVKALYDYRKVSIDLYKYVRTIGARVVIGELAKRGDDYLNLATYVDRDGVQSYAKTHVHWTENFAPGRKLKVFRTPVGNVGINICFDAAFPEVWRVLALKGAYFAVNISAVPEAFPSEYMWRRLSGASLNNQFHVVYANRAGRGFSGHSAVFSPTGEAVAGAGREEAVFDVEIDTRDALRWRRQEALYPHRRPLLYRDIIKHAGPF